MKTRVAILVIILLTVTTVNAQKRGKRSDVEKMTPEQRTEIQLKKMTLALDLSPSQASSIKPMLLAQANERKTMHEKRKDAKETGKKPTADECYAMLSQRLDRKIAFKAEMKRILNEKQYEKFEKIAERRAHKMKKRMERGKKRESKRKKRQKNKR